MSLLLVAAPAWASPVSFTGGYAENFDELGANGTVMPAGYRAMGIAGGNSTFNAANPITAAAIATAYESGTQTLTVWNPPADPYSNNTSGFRQQDALANAGSIGNSADRALGTGPTSTAATVIELGLVNNTGGSLASVSFAYDEKVLCMGNNGNESGELPGYSFFDSTDGATWTPFGRIHSR